MLKSLFGLVEDTVKIAIAPVAIAADVTRTVTKPAADLAEQISEGTRDILRDK